MNQTVSTTANFDLRAHMPLLARQAGVWAGVYRYYDADGNKIDEHRSRLICRVPDSGPHHYHQTNEYTWSDGRQEIREFKGSFRDGKLWFDSELIEGWAAEEPLDEHRRTLLLYWVRRGEPDTYLYEMIQLSDCGTKRCRTWHWIRNGQLETRTAIQEELVTKDWRSLEP
jgi:hypothetical protein